MSNLPKNWQRIVVHENSNQGLDFEGVPCSGCGTPFLAWGDDPMIRAYVTDWGNVTCSIRCGREADRKSAEAWSRFEVSEA